MDKKFTIRLATADDAASALDVYTPYVLSTAITFENDVPSVEEFRSRIENLTKTYPWLVCEYDGKIVGYAYGSIHRARPAYKWSPESTVYVAADFHRLGIAKVLYEALFALLKLQGFVNVFAGVVLPNVKSEGFHKALGFEEIGIFDRIGFKLGSWHSSKWFGLHLSEPDVNPSDPKPIGEVTGTQEFLEILEKANRELNK